MIKIQTDFSLELESLQQKLLKQQLEHHQEMVELHKAHCRTLEEQEKMIKENTKLTHDMVRACNKQSDLVIKMIGRLEILTKRIPPPEDESSSEEESSPEKEPEPSSQPSTSAQPPSAT